MANFAAERRKTDIDVLIEHHEQMVTAFRKGQNEKSSLRVSSELGMLSAKRNLTV